MKHSENKAAGAHQQAKGLLDELEEVRRKYGLAEEIAPRAGDSLSLIHISEPTRPY